ncbi:MAG: DUF4386 domain-containing protein [Alphaproteobacteria bacterium]|nr:DUF4386 domain-containing protein [Alphaproteobacteria bacterium]
MMERPAAQARIAGACYLVTIFAGAFAEFFSRDSLTVSGNAAATAHNIIVHETLFRFGLAADLVMLAAYLGVTWLLFVLLKPVSKNISGLAALFSLLGIAVVAANSINHAAVLVFLKAQTPALQLDQLNALAYSFLRLHGQGYNIASVFFGFYCALIGGLILRSTFLPRLVGGLMLLAGICFLVDSFAIILSPQFARLLYVYTSIASLVGEGSLTLWLLLFGVNETRWREQAGCHGMMA